MISPHPPSTFILLILTKVLTNDSSEVQSFPVTFAFNNESKQLTFVMQ